mmetsp:Transcript_53985/g.126114  ORF Transcript_53985/g.126114 Transcript_53985/m.126114 type:complete len:650 (+) Transcript_53985:101-2050(+)
MPPTCLGVLTDATPKPSNFGSEHEPNAEHTWTAQTQQDMMRELMETLDRHQKQVADLAAQQQKAFDTLRKKRDADDLPRAYQPRFGDFSTLPTTDATVVSRAAERQLPQKAMMQTELRREGIDSFSSLASHDTVVLDLDGEVPPDGCDMAEQSEASGASGTESSADVSEMSSIGESGAVGDTGTKQKKRRKKVHVDRSETLESKLMGQPDVELHDPAMSYSPANMRMTKANGWRCTLPLRQAITSHKFEMICTGILFANVLTMVLRLEMEGLLVGEELGEVVDGGVNRNSLVVMEALEVFFTMWFTTELILRLWAVGLFAVADALGAFDALIVVSTLLDYLLARLLDSGGGLNLASARMLRLLKVLKIFRTFKAASAFTELRILLRTVLRSTMALVWTMVVLSMIIVAASNLTAQMLQGFIMSEDGDHELRVWVFQHYGTASRAAYTMLEATLSGGWPNYARRLVMEVNPLWAIFWIAYVFAIIFAVIRVMGALFLAASLKAANEDDDMQALRRMKDSKEWTKKLTKVFWPDFQDSKRTGLAFGSKGTRYPARHMTRGHLESTLANNAALYKLAVYGFEPMEFRLLFDILQDGDDKVDRNAFLKAALRIKGGVKAIDVIEILREVEIMKKMMMVSEPARLGATEAYATL